MTVIGGNGEIAQLETPGKLEKRLFALKRKGECEPNDKRNRLTIGRVFDSARVVEDSLAIPFRSQNTEMKGRQDACRSLRFLVLAPQVVPS